MSKSIGNVTDPLEVIEGGQDQKAQPPYGADVLRLWAASVDFTSDVLVGPKILEQVCLLDLLRLMSRLRAAIVNRLIRLWVRGSLECYPMIQGYAYGLPPWTSPLMCSWGPRSWNRYNIWSQHNATPRLPDSQQCALLHGRQCSIYVSPQSSTQLSFSLRVLCRRRRCTGSCASRCATCWVTWQTSTLLRTACPHSSCRFLTGEHLFHDCSQGLQSSCCGLV